MIKIKQIKLNNFCNHIETVVPFNSINILAGDNNSGKTTVIQGILYVLKGFAGNMDDIHDQENEDRLIRNGADEMKIELEIEKDKDVFEFSKLKKRGMSVKIKIIENGKEKIFDDSKNEFTQHDIWEILNIDYRQLSAVIDSFYFMSLPLESREQLIFDTLGVGWTNEILRDNLEKNDIPEPFLSDYIDKIMHDGFEGAQKKADFCWTDLRMRLDNPISLDEYDEEITYRKKDVMVSELSIDEIRDDIKKVEDEKSELEQKRGRLERDAEFDVVGKDKEVLEINAIIQELKDKIKGYQPLDKIKERLAADKDEDEEIIEKLTKLQIDLALRNKEYEDIEFCISKWNEMKQGGLCNFCQSKLNASQVEKLLKILKKSLADIEKDLINLKIENKTFSSQHNEKIKSIEYQENLIDLIKTTTKQIEEKEILRDKIKQEIANNKDKAIKAREELQTITTRLKNIKKATEILKEIHYKVRSYLDAADRLNEFEKEKPETEKRLAVYDKLRKLLLSDGILKDIVQTQIKSLNDRLAFLNGYELCDPIQINDDFSVSIGDRHESQVHRRGSEFMRMGAIFSEVFSYLSGIGIWICDGTDILSANKRVTLLQIAGDIAKDYGNIIMVATRDQPQALSRAALEKAGLDPGLLDQISYFWVENGTVKQVPAVEKIYRQAIG